MVTTEDVIKIFKLLETNDIKFWLSGGWGIDALLGEKTRPHKDLDVIMLLEDVHRLFDIMAQDGYQLKMIWEENLWVADPQGNKIPTAFVLHDQDGREFDAHAIRLDEDGNGNPAWDAGDFIFTKEHLAGMGVINGVEIQCLTPESQVICHAGYELPVPHQRDMELLHGKFGVAYPDGESCPL
jgi:lincosamide nucleotidyltransferase A/C/D/E